MVSVPPELPSGPSAPSLVQTSLFWRRPFRYLECCRARYGDSFTLRPAGFPPLVFLSDQADVKAMFAAPADVLWPGQGGQTIMPIVGERSFMLLEEEQHLAGRRAVLPGLHARAVHEHLELIHAHAEREIASWPLGVPVCLHQSLRSLTLGIILARIFGTDELELLGLLRTRLLEMLGVSASLTLAEPRLRHGPGWPTWRRFLRNRAEVDELLLALIDRRLARFSRITTAASGDPDPSGDLLDLLLRMDGSGGSPPARTLRDNVMSLILAGHETTAGELAWAFDLLAHEPRVLDRLTSELDAGEQSTYLAATVREVLRHRPVFVFTIPRAVRRRVEIGTRTYAPPVHLLACIYLMHHDPRTYAEPQRFRPERFLEEGGEPSPWLPWGGGRKRCPGVHMAMLEMQVVLARALSSLTLTPTARASAPARWRSVIVTPGRGARLVLHRRVRAARLRKRSQPAAASPGDGSLPDVVS